MRIVRLTLLIAAQVCWTSLASTAALAGTGTTPTPLSAWSDLWRTPDQQGQALLDAGEPAQAAARFRDPRRRAYADLLAGRNQEAAKLLQPFADAQSEYNRGNALAKTGQLQAALAAYDAALKQAPADGDIRHNRELVERALRRQRQSPRSSTGNGKQAGQSAGSSGRDRQPGQSGAGQQGRGAAAQSGGASQSGDRGSRTGDRGSRSGDGGGAPAAGGKRAPNGSGNSGGAESEAGQARRDAAAAAALAREQRQRGGPGQATQTRGSSPNGAPESAQQSATKSPDRPSRVAGGTRPPKQKPETERQLALDQWLRQIPDSPAGLLQRKFLIEHMMRQQEGGEQQGDGP